MSGVDLRPILVDTGGDDCDGRLILARDRLVGVAVRLVSEEQGPLRGLWSLEAGFGPLEFSRPEPFIDLAALESWVLGVIGG